jgi:membrane associated rhomboid family serine protease
MDPLRWLILFAALLAVVELADLYILGSLLDQFGILPRTRQGLWGIVFMPFLHGGLGHLAANLPPLLILGFLILSRGKKDFFRATLYSWLFSGFGVWLIAPANTIHIGASGLVFGYFGFLVGCGLWEKRLKSFLAAALVVFIYGGMLYGLNPMLDGVSWQGHLFGLLGGLLAAQKSVKNR